MEKNDFAAQSKKDMDSFYGRDSARDYLKQKP